MSFEDAMIEYAGAMRKARITLLASGVMNKSKQGIAAKNLLMDQAADALVSARDWYVLAESFLIFRR